MTRYRYTIEGRDADGGNTWTTRGSVPTSSDIIGVAVQLAIIASYHQLTNGHAEYGKPGAGGCRGPYTITRVELVREDA